MNAQLTRSFFKFIPICLSIITIFIGVGCKIAFRNPELLTVNRVKIHKLSFEGLYLSFNAVVENPNKYKIQIHEFDAEVYIQEYYLGRIKADSTWVLKKFGTTDIPMVMKVKFTGLMLNLAKVLMNPTSGQQMEIQLKGSLKAKVKGISRRMDIQHREVVDISKILN